MDLIKWIIATAPEIFLLLAVAIGTVLGRQNSSASRSVPRRAS